MRSASLAGRAIPMCGRADNLARLCNSRCGVLSRPILRWFRISIVRAADKSGSRARSCMSGISARRPARPSSSVGPSKPKHLATIDVPDGWHSHKVRVSNGVMIVNHERFGKTGPTSSAAGSASTMCQSPLRKAHHQMDDQGRRRAPLRFRRPLCLYLADGRRLCRQHRHDSRSRGSRETAGGRPLVDSRSVERGRRRISLEQLGAAALSPSAAFRRPALCQLLASRLLHPGYFRPVEAEADFGREHFPGFPHPTHTCLRMPQKLRAGISWWWPTKTSPSFGRRRQASHGSMTSPMSRCRFRSRLGRCRASTSMVRRSRQ